MRIVIAGVPAAGKSRLAAEIFAAYGIPVRATDEAIALGWSEASEAVSYWFEQPGPWVVEGVAAARALRKWLGRHVPDLFKPCDLIVHMDAPFAP